MRRDSRSCRFRLIGIAVAALWLAGTIRPHSVAAFSWWRSSSRQTDQSDAGDPYALLQDGIKAYQQGDYNDAVSKLSAVNNLMPEDSPAVLYLGLSYLQLGNTAGAVSAWQSYTRLVPSTQSERTNDLNMLVAQNLTVLVREENQRTVTAAAAQEKTLAGANGEQPHTVAIISYRNLGTLGLTALGKGFAALMITDLSQVKGLTVVERTSIQTLLNELQLGKSGAVDPATAAKVGHLLGAGQIVTGSYLDPVKDELRIDSEVANTSTLQALGTDQVSGKLRDFYQLEKKIAFSALNNLGYGPRQLTPGEVQAVSRPETTSLAAFTDFSRGLNAEDNQDYGAAEANFQNAMQLDPAFQLAQSEHFFVHFHMTHHGSSHMQKMKAIANRVANRAPSASESKSAMTLMRMRQAYSSHHGQGSDHGAKGEHGRTGGHYWDHDAHGANSSNGMNGMNGTGGMGGMGDMHGMGGMH
ncbi:MAG: CsgG/HfaB family protein [Candidatus Binataceae bacterium]